MLTDFAPLVAMALVLKTVIDLLRYLKAGRAGLNGAVTLIAAMIGGLAVAALFASTDFADGIAVGDSTLGDLNFASLIVVGITIASAGSGFNELFGAIDSSRSTAKPKLVDSSEG